MGDSIDLSGLAFQQDPSAPPPIRPHAGDNLAGSIDAFNDPFGGDNQIDDIFRDTSNNEAHLQSDRDDNDRGLGIDEEVKVKKPRAKQAKLDDERLLGAKGIPTLRRISKERLKFRGKGHEFSDVTKLLNMYQLWLDDMFPKAKFTDGLAIIEKLGHSRRMQTMRREWIYEDKYKESEAPEVVEEPNSQANGSKTQEPTDDALVVPREDNGSERDADDDMYFMSGAGDGGKRLSEANQQTSNTSNHNEDEEEELYGAPPLAKAHNVNHVTVAAGSDVQGVVPEGDELDQALAEAGSLETDLQRPASSHGPSKDDEEAMAEMDW